MAELRQKGPLVNRPDGVTFCELITEAVYTKGRENTTSFNLSRHKNVDLPSSDGRWESRSGPPIS